MKKQLKHFKVICITCGRKSGLAAFTTDGVKCLHCGSHKVRVCVNGNKKKCKVCAVRFLCFTTNTTGGLEEV